MKKQIREATANYNFWFRRVRLLCQDLKEVIVTRRYAQKKLKEVKNV